MATSAADGLAEGAAVATTGAGRHAEGATGDGDTAGWRRDDRWRSRRLHRRRVLRPRPGRPEQHERRRQDGDQSAAAPSQARRSARSRPALPEVGLQPDVDRGYTSARGLCSVRLWRRPAEGAAPKRDLAMKRRAPLSLIPIVLVMGLVGTPLAIAQDGPTQPGEEVTFTDPDGIIRGTIAVREVADPFTGYDPSYAAEPGVRYVMLTVTYQAALDQQMDAQPYEVMLQSDDGRLWDSVYVQRPADSTIPDLQPQQLAPDNRISGVIDVRGPGGCRDPSGSSISPPTTGCSPSSSSPPRVPRHPAWPARTRTPLARPHPSPSRRPTPTPSSIPPTRPRRAPGSSCCDRPSRTSASCPSGSIRTTSRCVTARDSSTAPRLSIASRASPCRCSNPRPRAQATASRGSSGTPCPLMPP